MAFSIGRNENMQSKRFTILAVLAVSIGGGLALGTATAHADDVLPGLTCTRELVTTTCTNATNTDYTVIQTSECPGGYGYGYGFDPITGEMGFTHNLPVGPSVEHSSIFVPAHNSGFGPQADCPAGYPTSVHYSVEPPVPGPVNGDSAGASPPPG